MVFVSTRTELLGVVAGVLVFLSVTFLSIDVVVSVIVGTVVVCCFGLLVLVVSVLRVVSKTRLVVDSFGGCVGVFTLVSLVSGVKIFPAEVVSLVVSGSIIFGFIGAPVVWMLVTCVGDGVFVLFLLITFSVSVMITSGTVLVVTLNELPGTGFVVGLSVFGSSAG